MAVNYINASGLIPGYITYAYLEVPSTNSSFIDTGVVVDGNTEVEIEFAFTSTSISATTVIFGLYSSNSNTQFIFGTRGGLGVISSFGYEKTFDLDTKTHKITLGKYISFDGKQIWTQAISGSNQNRTAYLLAGNMADGSGANYFAKNVAIMSCKISKNGTLYRDYTPVKKILGGGIGFYDNVTKQFSSIPGLTPYYEGKIRDVQCLGLGDYEALEYISSDGTAYIDTGYTANTSIGVVADIAITEAYFSSGTKYLFGNSGGGIISFAVTSGGGTSWFATTSSYYSSSYVRNEIMHISAWSDKYWVNGSGVAKTTGNVTAGQGNFYIFRARSSQSNSTMRLYRFRLYESSNNGASYTLLRDFIPARRKSDSVLGLYDLKNAQFYPNSNSSGTFTAGKVIPWEIDEMYYGSSLVYQRQGKFDSGTYGGKVALRNPVNNKYKNSFTVTFDSVDPEWSYYNYQVYGTYVKDQNDNVIFKNNNGNWLTSANDTFYPRLYCEAAVNQFNKEWDITIDSDMGRAWVNAFNTAYPDTEMNYIDFPCEIGIRKYNSSGGYTYLSELNWWSPEEYSNARSYTGTGSSCTAIEITNIRWPAVINDTQTYWQAESNQYDGSDVSYGMFRHGCDIYLDSEQVTYTKTITISGGIRDTVYVNTTLSVDPNTAVSELDGAICQKFFENTLTRTGCAFASTAQYTVNTAAKTVTLTCSVTKTAAIAALQWKRKYVVLGYYY